MITADNQSGSTLPAQQALQLLQQSHETSKQACIRPVKIQAKLADMAMDSLRSGVPKSFRRVVAPQHGSKCIAIWPCHLHVTWAVPQSLPCNTDAPNLLQPYIFNTSNVLFPSSNYPARDSAEATGVRPQATVHCYHYIYLRSFTQSYSNLCTLREVCCTAT